MLTPIKTMLTPMTVASSSLGGDVSTRSATVNRGSGNVNSTSYSSHAGSKKNVGGPGGRRRHFFRMNSSFEDQNSIHGGLQETSLSEAAMSSAKANNISPESSRGTFHSNAPSTSGVSCANSTEGAFQGRKKRINSPRLDLGKLGFVSSTRPMLQQSPPISVSSPGSFDDEVSSATLLMVGIGHFVENDTARLFTGSMLFGLV